MYLRARINKRSFDNLAIYQKANYNASRVTKGYVLSNLLKNYSVYVKDEKKVINAIEMSDVKDEGPGTPVNFNITQEAADNLNSLKLKLDTYTKRSLFPAQIIDILLILATERLDEEKEELGKGKEENLSGPEMVKILVEILLDDRDEDRALIDEIKSILTKRNCK